MHERKQMVSGRWGVGEKTRRRLGWWACGWPPQAGRPHPRPASTHSVPQPLSRGLMQPTLTGRACHPAPRQAPRTSTSGAPCPGSLEGQAGCPPPYHVPLTCLILAATPRPRAQLCLTRGWHWEHTLPRGLMGQDTHHRLLSRNADTIEPQRPAGGGGNAGS